MPEDNNNNNVNSILAHLANAANVAADGVSDAFHSASHAVNGKYDQLRLNMDLSRLKDEQAKVFQDIGHTMFMIKSGAFIEEKASAEPGTEKNSMTDAQDTIDQLLVLADQKQQEIDLLSERINKVTGNQVCPVCGKTSTNKEAYCSSCGTKLN